MHWNHFPFCTNDYVISNDAAHCIYTKNVLKFNYFPIPKISIRLIYKKLSCRMTVKVFAWSMYWFVFIDQEKLYERDLHLGTHIPLGTWVLHYNVMTPQQWIQDRVNDLGRRVSVFVFTLLLKERCLCFWIKSSIFYLRNELQWCMSRFHLYESVLFAIYLYLKSHLGRSHF